MDGIILSPNTYDHIMQNLGSTEGIDPVVPNMYQDLYAEDYLVIKNIGSDDIPAGYPVGIVGRVTTDSTVDPVFTGAASADLSDFAGLATEDIPKDALGYVRVSGNAVAMDVFVNHADHKFVTVSSLGELVTAEAGPMLILGGQNGLTEFNVLIMPNGGTGVFYGTLSSDLATTDTQADVTVTGATNPNFFGGIEGSVQAENLIGSSGKSGDKILLWTNRGGTHVVVVNVESAGYSYVFYGTLNSAITDADTNASVNVVTSDHPGVSAGNHTVSNLCKHTADAGAQVVCIADPSLSFSIIINLECPL